MPSCFCPLDVNYFLYCMTFAVRINYDTTHRIMEGYSTILSALQKIELNQGVLYKTASLQSYRIYVEIY